MLSYHDTTLNKKIRLLGILLLLEYAVFIFSGLSFFQLHGDPFFSLGVDPFSWFFFIAGVPQLILSNFWTGLAIDSLIFLLLIFFVTTAGSYKIAIPLFLLLLCFYVTITGYLTHRNFQVGFVVVLTPFLFARTKSRQFAFEATRYFLLFFYVSAAFFKLFNNSLASQDHFSHHLATQFAPYFLENNLGFRTSINLYLIQHTGISHLLYILSFFAELIVVVGFFTIKFDKWLAAILLTFHLGNWIVMDLAPIGQLAFICLFFLSKDFIKEGSRLNLK